MLYRVVHTTKYAYASPVPICHNKVHLAPRETPRQQCREFLLDISPEPAYLSVHYDYFANRVDYFAIQDAARNLTITSTSLVDVATRPVPDPAESPPWEQLQRALAAPAADADLNASVFTMASEHVRRDPRFIPYALPDFSPGRPILEAARDLMARIHAEFQYDPRATNITTPVEEVLESRAGVCQDFAHLQISCLRSLGLAARYVSGYVRTIPPSGGQRLEGADASHAWVGVYCGKLGWVDLDPTNNLIVETDHVTLAYGRDYSDVCPVQGVFVGGGDHTMTVAVDVCPEPPAADPTGGVAD